MKLRNWLKVKFGFWEARINIVESKINVAHKRMVYISIDSALEVA